MRENEIMVPVEPVEENAEMEVDMVELFYHLLEKWKLIALGAFVGAVLMAVYSLFIATPMYEATTKLYVLNNGDSAINLSDLQIGSSLATDYKEAFMTWEVEEMVLQELNLDYEYEELEDMLTIRNPSNTRILEIIVKSDDPKEAQAISNTYADCASRFISDIMRTSKPSLFSEALLPTKPVSPRKTLNTILGFLLGAILVAGVLVVQFLMDDKIKTSDDLRKYINLPTLAIVPVSGAGDKTAAPGKRKGGRVK